MISNVPFPTALNVAWATDATQAINQLIGKKLNIVSKTAAHTLADGEDVLLGDATGAAFSVTLPAVALHTGRLFIVKKIDASANAVTIDGNGAETIDGAATVALSTQYESRTLLAGSSGWHVI
jgi:hypothetical protein